MDEKELIKKCKEGDTESFSLLVLMHEKKIFNYALRMLKNENDAEDASQEAFLRAYKKIDSFNGASQFSTWLYTIVNNVCLDMLRKKQRTGESTHISINQSTTDDEEYELQIEDTSPGPYEMAKRSEAGRVLEKAIASLSPEHRAVIIMRDINGLEYDEIAKITKTSLGTVKSRISRARISLRKILEENRELFS